MKELIILGAGGLGREVAWMVERINQVQPQWNLLGFMDKNPEISDKMIGAYKVLGDEDNLATYENVWVVCAIANPRIRQRIVQNLMQYRHLQFAVIIDPTAVVSPAAQLGQGSIICPHTTITVNTVLGAHSIVNYNATVGHDTVLDDYVTIYPGANLSGNVHVGQCAELGTGMQVIQGKTIGKQTIVGAGAVVVKDLPDQCTAVGSPARIVKYHHQ